MDQRIIFSTAANGRRTVRAGEVSLFSAYDPGKAAARFVTRALESRRPALVLVLGGVLGYLEEAVRTLLPHVPVGSVCYDGALAPAHGRGQSVWTPESPQALEDFLRLVIGEREAGEVMILEWPASARAFPEWSSRARTQVVRILRENGFGGLTVAASGRRWFANSLINFLRLEPVSGNPLRGGLPLVIAASGPSLTSSLPLLARLRDRLNLWALASSLPALREAGLVPDLVVTTDPGHYASALLLGAGTAIPPVAMPLSAARGVWRTGAPVLLFAQPAFFECELIRRSGLTVPAVDAHGTVAGSALLLARACGATRAVFCGLDFCHRDIRSHVTPHAWDARHEASARRLSPLTSLLWERTQTLTPETLPDTGCRTGPSLQVYASSFTEICARITAARLNPSPVDVPGMETVTADELEGEAGNAALSGAKPALSPARHYPGREERKRIVDTLLGEWIVCLEREARRPAATAPGLVDELLRFLAGVRPGQDSGGSSGAAAARRRTAKDFLTGLRSRYAGETAYA